MGNWGSGDTGIAIFNILPKVYLNQASLSRESILFASSHGPFPSYLYRFRLHHSDIRVCGEKGDTFHYATSCHLMSYFHFTKPSAENTLLWWKNFLLNTLSRIKIAKLISFVTENENLIKQQPDFTSSSDSSQGFLERKTSFMGLELHVFPPLLSRVRRWCVGRLFTIMITRMVWTRDLFLR
ncbi:hypothetical protein AVEN_275482-1 [Araneus ventricosus]|uniref:Uncharacterized protein n=1 Tax=Araneus ventricosus TaxID=182803 RepID=A0A4Y2ERR2_ARAVE|nr:hypothetical protein AVEN_275482-1 [Araneus ventricosus]